MTTVRLYKHSITSDITDQNDNCPA